VSKLAGLVIEGKFNSAVSLSVSLSYPLSINRVNWTGAALSTFYAAIRKALIVVIVVRAILVLTGAMFSAWWVFFR
jgi:hypothetical protein